MTPEDGVRQSWVLILCDLNFSEPRASFFLNGDDRIYLPGSEITSKGPGTAEAVTTG